jgi:hypothetical protein
VAVVAAGMADKLLVEMVDRVLLYCDILILVQRRHPQ